VILAFAPINVMFYWGIVIVDHAIDYYRKYQERELRASQLEAQLVASELQVLKLQLHPHFLFNTLNTISALIHESPEEADEMISQLGDLLRVTLETVHVHEVPLTQELDFLKHYLAIEQTRFQDRLRITMSIEPETLDAMVPNLILQPLVENSIRHGIALRPEARSIEIKSWQDNGTLRLRVADDGPGLSSDKLLLKEGVGLTTTRQRLSSLYGTKHDFSLQNSPRGGLVVELTIPFKTAEAVS
jgi:LytS/YehU family sensor histidine kinase